MIVRACVRVCVCVCVAKADGEEGRPYPRRHRAAVSTVPVSSVVSSPESRRGRLQGPYLVKQVRTTKNETEKKTVLLQFRFVVQTV